MRALLRAVALFLALTGAALAGPFEDADAAYIRGDYTTTFRIIRPLAERGDARAQNLLGVLYSLGQGATQDYSAALRWFAMSAEQGNPSALLNLARMYYTGRGINDLTRAHMYSNLAAVRLSPGSNLETAIAIRNAAEGLMTSRQIAEAQRLAREWDAAHPRR